MKKTSSPKAVRIVNFTRYIYHCAALLLAIVMLSACSISNMYAKFYTGSSAYDAARAAAFPTGQDVFAFTADYFPSSITQSMTVNDSGDIMFIQASNCSITPAKAVSEVDLKYSITIESTGNLPFKYILKFKKYTAEKTDKDASVTDTTGVEFDFLDGSSVTFDGGVLPAGYRQNHEYYLEIVWDDRSAEYADTPELINITINYTQID